MIALLKILSNINYQLLNTKYTTSSPANFQLSLDGRCRNPRNLQTSKTNLEGIIISGKSHYF